MNEEQRRNELKALIDHVPLDNLDSVLHMLNTFIPVDNSDCAACLKLRTQLMTEK